MKKQTQAVLNENHRIGRGILKAIINVQISTDQVVVREQQKGPMFYWIKRELSELSLRYQEHEGTS